MSFYDAKRKPKGGKKAKYIPSQGHDDEPKNMEKMKNKTKNSFATVRDAKREKNSQPTPA